MKNKYIAIMADDTPELVTGILAILKSGNCFVPINPIFPNDRIRFILNDCNIDTLLTDKANSEKARQIMGETPSVKHLIYTDDIPGIGIPVKKEKERSKVNAAYPAYVIYTSGSTGNPKGVPITHGNLIPLFNWFRDYFQLGVDIRVMQNLSYTFDFGVFEILSTLLFGGRLYIVNKDTVGDFSFYVYFIARRQINTLHTTPVFFSNLADAGRKISSIKLLHLGGERLTGKIVRNALRVTSPGCRIYNGYGPTEASINCAIFSLADGNMENDETNNIPIGRPSAFHEIYILDRFLNLQPIGAAGELCIAGPGLSRGYLNRPGLTAEKFKKYRSYRTNRTYILYKTGDLARWLADGDIEFLGRIDQQVKIRGFRIELEEIENCLSLYQAIKETVVVARGHENGGNYLCAYFVTQSPGHPTVSQLREFLSKRLPDYMIPAYFIHLEKIPLTPNGKIDRKALPEPDETFIDTGVEYVAAVTETEKILVFIWQGLLAVKRIGVMDDFFQVGGDSILVNRCIARIREDLHAEIPLRKFFERPYIKALAEEIERQERQVSSIKPAARVGEIPLSFAQERLWFLQELDADNVAYFVPRVIRMKGKLEAVLIEHTFTEIVRRHEILRTTFPTVDGQPVQRIQPPYEFKIPVLDWSWLEEPEQGQKVSEFLSEEDRRPFDFAKGPLLRVTILKLKEEEHLFVLTEHHLVHDGWTQGVLLNEFIRIFTAYSEGTKHDLPELPIQYADYAVWQRNHLKGTVLERHLAYWKEKLAGLVPLLELPSDRPRPPVISGKGGLEIVRLPGPSTIRLKEVSRKNGVTLFMTMLAVFKTLLYRYTGVKDICVGTGVANRRYKEMEGMLGMVINTLALRTQVDGEISFIQCLHRVKETCLEAYQHEDTPFGKLVEVLQPERNLSYTPLFQVLFSFMDTPGEALRLPGLELELLPTHNRSAKFDINVVVVPRLEQEHGENGEMLVEWEYNTDIFEADTITRMIAHYHRLLEQGLDEPETNLSSLYMMSDAELKQVLYEFNDTETPYPRDKTIHQLFAEQVEQTPDYVGLVGDAGPVGLTYRQLNEQSDCLAQLLIKKGVLANDIVAIMIERSILLIVGIIGILKTGGAYLPIDPEYPRERIDYMLKDSGAQILVNEKFFGGCRGAVLQKSPPGNLAYIMYTSGSTGQPKGVVVAHRNVVRLVKNTNFVPLTAETRILQTGASVFDAATFEIWGCLLNGGQLVLVHKEVILDAQRLNGVLKDQRINTLWLSAPLFNQLMQQNIELFAALSYLLVGGDVLSPEHINRVRGKFPCLKIINGYGPTENTTFSTTFLIDREYTKNIPIGRPIANSTAYIVDKYNHLQPIGVPGELWVGGDGVGSGYLNCPELTVERFNRTYRTNKTYILYKTGDVARWLPDGNIEFLGRRDFQVKIRGFRVELGEIENRLLTHEGIRDAVVIFKEYLAAYIVSTKEIETERLREYLAEKLPAYMVPSHFVPIERIPLTPNGKVDRKALPDPVFKADGGYSKPRNKIEEKLAAIWAEVLSEDAEHASQLQTSIGIDDDFFNLGGHSLKASILAAKIHKELNVKIPLVEIFENPTIAGLSKYIQATAESKYISIEPTEKREYYELSSAQKRFYVLYRMDETGTAYNIPYAVHLEGTLEINRLEATFRKLIHRHESLRTSFDSIGETPIQRIHENVEFEIEYYDLAAKNAKEREGVHVSSFIIHGFIRSFDLSKAPLFRVGLVKEREGKHILVVDLHHIIADGTSANLLIKEFMAFYAGAEIAELRIQYKDFCQWQNDSLASGKLKKQEEYWLNRFAGELPVLDMPTDFPRPLLQSFDGDTIGFNLEEELLRRLNAAIKASGTTLYIMLLAVHTILLSKYSRQSDIIIGSPIAGRNHVDLEKIIGLLIETVTMRNYPEGDKPFQVFLAEVKENTLTAFENQAYPFRELIKNTASEADLSHNPLFDAMLMVQNMEMAEFKIPGLELTPYVDNDNTKHAAKVDLTITVTERAGGLDFILEYCTRLFKRERMERLAGHFVNMLRAVVQNPGILLSQIDMLSDEEKRQLLEEFNGPKLPYPETATIPGLFTGQAKRVGDRVSVIGRGGRGRTRIKNTDDHALLAVTYKELNEMSDSLACVLIQKGVQPDTIVAIMMERSIEIMVGILGILKAGGAYLPIDPDYPQDRIDYMLRDSGARVLINKSEIRNPKFETNPNDQKINVQNKNFGIPFVLDFENLNFEFVSDFVLRASNFNSSNLAYLIYTSGSTGKPKGVMVEHKNLAHYVHAFAHEFVITEEDTVLQQASYAFDAFAEEVYPAMLAGGKIAIPAKNEIIDIDLLSTFILKNKITIVDCSPLLLNELDKRAAGGSPRTIRIAISGGDVLKGEYIAHLLKAGTVYNTYGPTETTICAAYYKCSEANPANIPIGKPVANYSVHILAESGHFVPIGVPGELCIAGPGVARGYLNRPELSAEKFKLNRSYRSYMTYIIYKSGDLARWLPDGNIEFLGRVDQQVKIRGFRIELGEIESQLLKYDRVKETVVIDRNDKGEKYLCAYIVFEDARAFSIAGLREFLMRSLPDYMVPSYFINLDKIPLTGHGKVDRRALPGPQTIEPDAKYIAARDDVEDRLAGIWAEVLGIEKKCIGIDADFFELGGHSLNATLMLSRIHKEFNVKLSLADIFRQPFIRGLVEYIRSAGASTFIPITLAPPRDYYVLSSPQQRLYILQQMYKNSTGYNLPTVLQLEGELEVGKLEKIFKELIIRHESLRTSFHMIEEKLVQEIHDPGVIEFTIQYTDVSFSDEILSLIPQRVSQFLRAFDLSAAPLFRVGLLKAAARKYILMVDMHHIISDGTSLGVLIKEFMALYSGEELPPLRVQYKDYAEYQGSAQNLELLRQQSAYWLTRYQQAPPVLDLPLDYPRPTFQSFAGTVTRFEVGVGELNKLKQLVQGENVTLYMVLLAAYSILLSRLSGQEDIVIGAPMAGRRHIELASIIGMFVNTLALRFYPEGDKTFQEFLAELKQETLDAIENQEYPFEDLVEQVGVNRDLGRNPLFDAAFILQNVEIPTLEIPGLTLRPYPHDNKIARFDLLLQVFEIGAGNDEKKLVGVLEYCTQLFKSNTIDRFIGYFKRILSSVIENPGKKIAELEIIPGAEKKRILEDFNATAAEYPKDKTIQQIFAEQAERLGDRIALTGMGQITYRELNEMSNRLAYLLYQKGVVPGSIVAIMMERSIDLIIGILGILKAGAAYLPIDPGLPGERIDYMLKDSNAKIIVGNRQACSEEFNFQLLMGSQQATFHHSSYLAYIIYTSGSTGIPKGVPITHANLCPLLHWGYDNMGWGTGDHVIQTLAYYFDWSAWEIFLALTSGASLYIITEDILLNPGVQLDFIRKNDITVMETTPTRFQSLIAGGLKPGALNTLRCLCIGAEKLTLGLVIQAKELIANNCRVFNLYGPTEATIISAALEIDMGALEKYEYLPGIPIGRMVGNGSLLVLDKYLNVCPVNVVGELYITGDGVARGYLNNPQLTAEKFVKYRSYGSYRTYMLYRTGDLARWLPDPAAETARGPHIIEFLGRVDRQVKIRGFRIELGEIESILLKYGRIKEAVVIDRQDKGEKYLCAYIVPVSHPAPEPAELRTYLSSSLPGYMIPSYFIAMEKIPLNPNGKIDWKALPVPESKIKRAVKEYTVPRDAVEKKLAEIWAEVLKLQFPIGIDDNFFDLGGHSLNATLLTARLHKAFHVRISLKEFFQMGCIREVARYIKEAVKEEFTVIEPVEEKEYYELSSAQERLYILYRMDERSTAYNIPYAVQLEGKLDRNHLEMVFKQLILRHESLRTSFVIIGEETVQRIHDEVEFEIEYDDLAAKNAKEREGVHRSSIIIQPFDLSKAPLLRVRLMKLAEEKYILAVDMHHIISDGMSTEVLVHDFSALYAGQGLPLLNLQYKDYTEWQNRAKSSQSFQRQGEYWQQEFAGEKPVLELPLDYSRPAVKDFAGSNWDFEIDRETTGALKALTLETGATLYMLLLAIYTVFLARITGQEAIVVGTPVACRGHADLEKIIGMFVNTLALQNFPSGEKGFTGFLAEVKERTIKAFENQDYQYEDLVEQAAVNRDTGRNPLFDTMFVLQNTGPKEMAIPGLKLVPLRFESETSQFDLLLGVKEEKEILAFRFEYSTSLFKRETIQRFITYFKNIVRGVAEDKYARLSDLEIIQAEEKNRILYEFNNTEAQYPADKTIHELFTEQAEQNPDRIALVGATAVETLRATSLQTTYRELNDQSDRLAVLLVEKGVLPDSIVGIMIERSVEMMIGIYGILKAGGAYLPIDPVYPQDRVDFMLKDSGAKIMLGRAEEQKSGRAEFVFSYFFLASTLPRFLASNSPNLAYIIYTSGSTGRPKGVVVEHKSVVNLLFALFEKYPLNRADCYLLKTTYVFDVSVTELFGWFLGGGRLAILEPGGEKDPKQIIRAVENTGVTHINFVPSMFNIMLDLLNHQDVGALKSLRYIFLAGEALMPESVREFKKLAAGILLENLYGPTESTVYAGGYSLRGWSGEGPVPIGTPLPNIKLYILDKYDRLQPVGIPGELCISGAGTAAGYLNRPELSAEKFKFNRSYGSYMTYILYRTGDLARWLPDGNIEFLGRIDQQVKIRGYRIELGEIENRLKQYAGINEAVVIAKEDNNGEKYLCAFIVPGKELGITGIKDYLLSYLPGYMVPSYFAPIEKIPLTPNGKVDTKALPEPFSGPVEEYIAPGNEDEVKLTAAWSEVLGIEKEKIGINDNFFDLGGNSLKIIRLSRKLEKNLNKEIPVLILFRYPTIHALSEYLNQDGLPVPVFLDADKLEKIEDSIQDTLRIFGDN